MTGHANQGLAWELLLEEWHGRYRRAGRAVVLRGHPPVKLLSRKDDRGRFQACFQGDGPPDFFGCSWSHRGRAVVLDAKATDRDRWPLDQLQKHQASDLEAVHLAGGLAFVALVFHLGSSAGQGFVLAWDKLGPRWKTWRTSKRAAPGEASLTVLDCHDLGVPMRELGDWLGAMEAL